MIITFEADTFDAVTIGTVIVLITDALDAVRLVVI
jgi:ubiquinone/menaquinone biosynthesis C-methylase UbiE